MEDIQILSLKNCDGVNNIISRHWLRSKTLLAKKEEGWFKELPFTWINRQVGNPQKRLFISKLHHVCGWNGFSYGTYGGPRKSNEGTRTAALSRTQIFGACIDQQRICRIYCTTSKHDFALRPNAVLCLKTIPSSWINMIIREVTKTIKLISKIWVFRRLNLRLEKEIQQCGPE